MQSYLLSICIPTYNRARQLEQSLISIVGQAGFNQIEVVISDNCSQDNTRDVAMAFVNRYPNIRYFRNEINIHDANFPLALQRGTGIFRKLSNDTVLYYPGAVQHVLSLVEKYKKDRPVIYFLNGANVFPLFFEKTVFTADDFLKTVGHWITWIASVAAWEEDCAADGNAMKVFQACEHTKLAQVAFLIEMMEKKNNKVIVCNRKIMKSIVLEKKDVSYGLYDVFYYNLLEILYDYRQRQIISESCIEYIRKDLLLRFFAIWVAEFEMNNGQFLTRKIDLRKQVSDEYGNETYYTEYLWLVKKRKCKIWANRIRSRIFGR